MSTNTTSGTKTYVPCTLQTCPLSEGIITYQPNVGANALFAALFGLLLLVQLGLGVRYKTWSFLIAMSCGLILEIVGYIGRVQLHNNPFSFTFFIEYLVCLTIAPAFLTAAIYVSFSRVVHSCDARCSWIRPKTISIIFMTSDFFCLALQAVGGAITSTSGGDSEGAKTMRQTGVNIMIAGLSLQVVSLFLFILNAGVYAWRWQASAARLYRQPVSTHRRLMWRILVLGIFISSVTIFVRSAFRVAELREGFQSPLASNEVSYMVLEGAMIIIACFTLTVGHPGLCLTIPWKIPRSISLQSRNVDASVALESVHMHKSDR